jgi:hypothetical protein
MIFWLWLAAIPLMLLGYAMMLSAHDRVAVVGAAVTVVSLTFFLGALLAIAPVTASAR